MESIVNLLLVFYTFSFVGWCIEITLKYRQFGRFINRGFLLGPWLPIYGAGVSLVTVTVYGQNDIGFAMAVLISTVVCGVIEYLASYFLEKLFHARWWDYTQKPMNLKGRVWIGNLFLFGIGGTATIYVLYPILYRLFFSLSFTVKSILAGCISVLFIVDLVVSCYLLRFIKNKKTFNWADNTEEIRKEMKVLLSEVI